MTRNRLAVTSIVSFCFVLIVYALTVLTSNASAALVDPNAAGVAGQNMDQSYDLLVSKLTSNSNVVGTIQGNKMWVPWYASSSMCTENELQKGGNCNSGQTIDGTHNCMVTDEFSQVGILVAMSKDATKMDQFYNTVVATKSTNGNLPAWRVYRNGDTIEACKPGINGNCDTASDASARIIIALYTAANNNNFPSDARTKYKDLANKLSADFVTYEVDQTCRPSSIGGGDICYWMAAGSQAKRGGLGSWDYAYTGYFADGTIAMLQACSATGDQKYCTIAKDISRNYLQAAKWNGNDFSAPPGRSFKWNTANGAPVAECTGNCNPVAWDSYDAPRAFGMCEANYHAKQMGMDIGMDKYCQVWGQKYMNNANTVPLTYTPSGTAGNYESSYMAQGLQALMASGYSSTIYNSALKSALSHYTPEKGTWDWASCYGVYAQAFPVRALGVGLGRDAASFKASSTTTTPTTPTTTPTTPTTTTTTGTTTYSSVEKIPATCTGGTITTDSWTGGRTIKCTNGADSMQVQAWDKGSYFELYKQTTVGSKVTQMCIGTACVGTNGGYAKSASFPLSYTAPTTTTPTTPTTTTPPPTTTQPVPPPSSTTTTYSSVEKIPATCTGGTITSDVWTGGRTITCTNGGDSLKIQAWDKGTFFEMYKVSKIGSKVSQICIGATCISSSGYAKSATFPITATGTTTTTPTTTTPPPTTPTTTTPTTTKTSYSSAQNIPATCTGGTITSDVWNGGRTIKCTNGADSMQVQAWDKGSYYEVYKQTTVGSSISKICIGTTCISDGGFAKSANFPIAG